MVTIARSGSIYSLAALFLFAFIVAAFSLTAENTLRFVGIALGVCFVVVTIKHKFVPSPEAFLYMTWATWSSVSYIGTEHPGPFVQVYRVVLQMIVLMFGVSTLTRYLAKHTVALTAIVTGAVVSAAYATIEEDFLTFRDSGDDRVSGLLNNANGFGYEMLLALMAIAMLWGIVQSRRSRYLLIVTIPFLIAGLISSGSRKNFVGFMTFLFLWIILAQHRGRRLRLRSLIMSGTMLVGAIFLYDFVMNETIVGRRFRHDFNEVSAQEMRGLDRFEYYILGLEIIADNPVIGIGFGSFKFNNPSNQDSHSDYIEVAASTGIPGAMLYFAIYIMLWRRLGRISRAMPKYTYLVGCSKASILTILIVSTGMLQFSAPIHWCFVGILSGIAHHGITTELANATITRNFRPLETTS